METTDPTLLETLVPYWPGIVTLLGFFIVGAFAIWNRRRGAVEAKYPTVSEMWQEDRRKESELDIERGMRRWFENAFYDLRRALHQHIDSAHDGDTNALKPHQRKALNATPPNLEKETP